MISLPTYNKLLKKVSTSWEKENMHWEQLKLDRDSRSSHFLSCDPNFFIPSSEWDLPYMQNRSNLYFPGPSWDLWEKNEKARRLELVPWETIVAHQKQVFFQSTLEYRAWNRVFIFFKILFIWCTSNISYYSRNE